MTEPTPRCLITEPGDKESDHEPTKSCPLFPHKQRILAQADQAKGSGGGGALLRREGLYASLLTAWRREVASGTRQALTPHKRGQKSQHHLLQEENQKLQKENVLLVEELRKAVIVIDVQKQVGALLGWPIPALDPDGGP